MHVIQKSLGFSEVLFLISRCSSVPKKYVAFQDRLFILSIYFQLSHSKKTTCPYVISLSIFFSLHTQYALLFRTSLFYFYPDQRDVIHRFSLLVSTLQTRFYFLLVFFTLQLLNRYEYI